MDQRISVKTACAFTGHRPNKLCLNPKDAYNEQNPTALYVKKRLQEEIERLIKKGVDTFISGMALGVDTWAAEIVLSLKPKHPHLKLVAAVPFKGQEKKWSKGAQERFSSILKRADVVQILSEGGYSPIKMQIRNKWMIDHAKTVLAVWDGSRGGTWNAIRYAKSAPHQPTIIRIHPRPFR